MSTVSAADRGDLGGYFEEAASWDTDRIGVLKHTARVAWCVAGAGWICAVMCALALLLLMPLKRVDPFVIRVDSSTGVVDVAPVYAGGAAMDEAVSRYFLTHYVTVCERFNYSTAESDYEECGAFHTAQRNQAWYALWNPSNPKSPLNLHRDGSLIRSQVQSVSFFKRASGISDLAQVRYLKNEQQGPDAPPRITRWIATIQFAYGAPPRDPAVRRWNPLGFKIIEFGSEPEVLDESQDQSPSGIKRVSP
ncbi:MAG: type IV secretion system protein [Steroidobacteraceae bacterium]|jgi:type IV secretion system protein VirB8